MKPGLYSSEFDETPYLLIVLPVAKGEQTPRYIRQDILAARYFEIVNSSWINPSDWTLISEFDKERLA